MIPAHSSIQIVMTVQKPACASSGVHQVAASGDFTVHWHSLLGDHTAENETQPQRLLAC